MIFISYAREDQVAVVPIYERLRERGYAPWMDLRDIVGGEDWERAISQAITKADFFLSFLSTKSVQKRGVLQREILGAIEKWKEKLPDDIYLIPIRLEECELPERLAQFQAIDLYAPDGWERLLGALELGRRRLGQSQAPRQNDLARYAVTRQSERGEEPEDPPYVREIHYPQIYPADAEWVTQVNDRMSGWVAGFRQDIGRSRLPWLRDAPLVARRSTLKSSLLIDYSVALFNQQLFCVEFKIWSYGAGAAHGNTNFRTFNFWLQPVALLELADLFSQESPFLPRISEFSRDVLFRKRGSEDTGFDDWIERGTTPSDENFKNFSITNSALKVLFSPYHVGPFAWGSHEILIPYDQMHDIIRPNGPLAALKNGAV
jgi:hypothetical protein